MPYWKLLATVFTTIFVAELGDKTQLATLSMAASRGPSARWMVFAGASLALLATSAIGVFAGGALTRWISPLWLRRAAGALFIALGLLFLLARPDSPPR